MSTNGSVHAFPHLHVNNGALELEGGLSKREMFAMAAMQGLLAGKYWGSNEFGYRTQDEMARIACEHADATLAELDKS